MSNADSNANNDVSIRIDAAVPPPSDPPDGKTMAQSPSLVAGQIIAERYKIVSLLGTGGMGHVYKVEQIFLRKTLALKTLSSKNVSKVTWRRFQKEARAANSLDHPALVKVQDFGMIDGAHPFFVMDLVEGDTLSHLLKKGPLPLNTVLAIFQQVCLGLGYAHGQGVIHRDIKPSNIMVSNASQPEELRVKIVDFGIAKIESGEAPESMALTRTGDIFGTPYYMSPEQCTGIGVDHRADVYSVGCVMFEALTGSPPFISDTALSMMMRHQSELPASLQEASLGKKFPIGLEQVVAKLLEKQPRARYQTLLDVAADLQRIMVGEAVELGVHGPARPALKEDRISRWLYILIAALSAAVFCTIGFFAGSRMYVATKEPVKTNPGLYNYSNDIMHEAGTYLTPEPAATMVEAPAHSYFSADLGNGWRYFHFPEEPLGVITFPGKSTVCHVLEERTNTFSIKDRALASGVVIVEKFQPGEIRLYPTLSDFSQLKHMRPDEVRCMNLSQHLSMTDGMLKDIEHLVTVEQVICGSSDSTVLNNELTNAAIDSFNHLPHLEKLWLSKCSITADGLLKLKRLSKLTDLRLSSMDGMNKVLTKISGSKILMNLALPKCKLNNESLALIGKMPNIEELDLSDNPEITDTGLSYLTKLHHLHMLSINGCPKLPTALTVEYLKKLPINNLTLNDKLSPQIIEPFKKAMPHLEIDKPSVVTSYLRDLPPPPAAIPDRN